MAPWTRIDHWMVKMPSRKLKDTDEKAYFYIKVMS